MPNIEQRYEKVLGEIFYPLERVVQLTGTLANKHPKGTKITLVGLSTSLLLAWMIMGDPVKDHLPIAKTTQATLTNSEGNTLTPETGLFFSKDVQVIGSTDKPVEKFDYSDWKPFRGNGFTLKYPNQRGWEDTANGIVLIEPSGNMPVLMTTWVDSLKNTTFASYVKEQYDLAVAIDRTNPFAVVSQPANLPGLREAGLRGEVLAYKKQPGPGQLPYNERHFMIESGRLVINWVIDERSSNGVDYSKTVDSILKSAQFPGIQK